MTTALAAAILSCLMETPQSGYDLSKQFSETLGFFWNAAQQQIYRELSKLETEGLVTAEAIPREGRLDKKIYSITDLGKQSLLKWMAEPSHPCVIREDLLIKISAGNLVPREDLIAEVERRRNLHLKALQNYQAIEPTVLPNPTAPTWKEQLMHLTLRRGIRFEAEWVDWCDEALQILKESR
jgi:DNA-binding PadR family transcriptional regulator